MEERRQSVVGAASAVKWYVILTLATAGMTVAGVVLVAIFVPTESVAAVNTTLIGITAPIIATLLGKGLLGVAVSVDGKLSQLVQAKAAQKHAEGYIEGLKENPNTNIS